MGRIVEILNKLSGGNRIVDPGLTSTLEKNDAPVTRDEFNNLIERLNGILGRAGDQLLISIPGVDVESSIEIDPDAVAPGVPTNLALTPGIQLVVVTWTPPSGTSWDVVEIYRHTSDASGSSTKVGEMRGIMFVDDKLANGTQYFYWLKSRGFNGNQSAFTATANTTTLRIATDDLADAAVEAAKLTEQALRFTTDLAFVADSSTQVSWATGTIKTTTTTYSITGANTGAMSALTYIYLDPAVSTTLLQTTTNYLTAIGERKIWMCVAKNHASLSAMAIPAIGVLHINRDNLPANIISATEILADTITANEIAATTITASELATNSVTTAKLDAVSVTAAKVAVGVLTATHMAAESIITAAIQIDDAIITTAKIVSLVASKITAGTMQVALKLGVDNINLDGVNDIIEILDNQGTPRQRIKLGKLGAGNNDWGIQVFDAAGVLEFDTLQNGVLTNGIKDSNVTTGKVAANGTTQDGTAAKTTETIMVTVGTEVDLVCVSITTVQANSPVQITCSSDFVGGISNQDGDWTMELRLYRDTTLIQTGTCHITRGHFTSDSTDMYQNVAMTIIDAPATAATYVYEIRANNSVKNDMGDEDPRCDNSYISVTELKR